MDPIRIFVGTEEKTHVAYRVLEHSIRTRTRRPVEVTPMIGGSWEYDRTGIKVGTGFSLRRWMIPAACNWQGHAIYLDADQLVLADVGELFDTALDVMAKPVTGPATIACTWQKDKYHQRPALQTSVMVIDCGRAEPYNVFHIDRVLAHLRAKGDKMEYVRLMHADGWGYAPHSGPLPVEWNHLNVYEEGKTRLLHYTKEDAQPWYKPDHPLAYLWKQELVETLKAGGVTRAEMETALGNWGKKEDWRPTNGLHPSYRKFLVSAVR